MTFSHLPVIQTYPNFTSIVIYNKLLRYNNLNYYNNYVKI